MEQPTASHRTPMPSDGLRAPRSYVLGLIPLVGICLLPSLYMYAQNAAKCAPADLLPILGLTLLIGLIGYTVLWLLFGRYAMAAALMATLVMAFFSYFGALHALSKTITGSDTTLYAYAFLILVCLIALVVLIRSRKRPSLRIVFVFVSVLIGVLLAVNALTALLSTRSAPKVQAAAAQTPADERLPNLYYLLMDEYAPFETMEQYYGTDMSGFRTFLLDRAFSVSKTSYNATRHTVYNIANNLNLSDTAMADGDDEGEARALSENALIYRVLSDLGYQTSAVSSARGIYAVPERITFGNTLVGPITQSGETVSALMYKQTALYPFSQKFLSKIATNTSASAAMNYLADPQNLPSERGQALLCYVLSPHVPYTHNPDGTLRPHDLWFLPHDVDGYLSQHAYTTAMLERIVDAILSVDPDCVIVIQSDHNYRYGYNDLTLTGVLLPEEEFPHVFNAVYFRGEPIDVEGLSGPETLRLVLQKLGWQPSD